MGVDGTRHKVIREALVAACTDRGAIDRLAIESLAKNLNELVSEDVGVEKAADALLDWIPADRVPDLLRELVDRASDNQKVVAAVRAYAAPDLRFRGAALLPAPPLPALPDRPYPLLEPYRHPDTLTGRDREIVAALRALDEHPLILCLHAASGAGKSSFLRAGILPRLRARGVPVVVNARPDEAGIARRLGAGLLSLPPGTALDDDDLPAFVHAVDLAGTEAKQAPVIILDQFEDAFRRSESGEALSRLGPLLAATTELGAPDGQGFRCRWVLSYRHEYHGQVDAWLRDVLSDARIRGRGGLDQLPHDLNRRDYLRVMPIEPLGKAASREDVRKVFLAAITKPLGLKEKGESKYRLRFAEGGAERLADAFAEARLDRPRAPLLPELQVVLDELVQGAKVGADETGVISVPDDLRDLVTGALGRYLEGSLKSGFTGNDAKRMRAVALLTLRQLADAEGKRGEGMAPAVLEQRLRGRAKDVLRVLEDARLVIRAEDEGPLVLPHDRLAAVVVGIWSDPEKRKAYELDEEVVAVQGLVRNRMEMRRLGDWAGFALDDPVYQRIDAVRDCLFWDEDSEAWWRQCVERRKRQTRRFRWMVAVGLLTVVPVLTWVLPGMFEAVAYQRVYDRMREADTPEKALAALEALKEHHRDESSAARDLYDEKVQRWFDEYKRRMESARDLQDVWEAYQGAAKLRAREAKEVYAAVLIRESEKRSYDGHFDQALLLRLLAASSYGAVGGTNLREAAYLASLFVDPTRPPREPEGDRIKNWAPNGAVPHASSTEFVGDYVMRSEKEDGDYKFDIWSTRNGKHWRSTIQEMGPYPIISALDDDWVVVRESARFCDRKRDGARCVARCFALYMPSKLAICSDGDERVGVVHFAKATEGHVLGVQWKYTMNVQSVKSAEFSADGNRLAVLSDVADLSGSTDGSHPVPKGKEQIGVYDVESGKTLATGIAWRSDSGHSTVRWSHAANRVIADGNLLDVGSGKMVCDSLPPDLVTDPGMNYGILKSGNGIELWDIHGPCVKRDERAIVNLMADGGYHSDRGLSASFVFGFWIDFAPNAPRLAVARGRTLHFFEIVGTTLLPKETRVLAGWVGHEQVGRILEGGNVEILVHRLEDADFLSAALGLQTVRRDPPGIPLLERRMG